MSAPSAAPPSTGWTRPAVGAMITRSGTTRRSPWDTAGPASNAPRSTWPRSISGNLHEGGDGDASNVATGHGAAGQPAQHRSGADVEERPGSEVDQRFHALPPPDGPDE